MYAVHALLTEAGTAIEGIFKTSQYRLRVLAVLESLKDCVIQWWILGRRPQNEDLRTMAVQKDTVRRLRLSIGVVRPPKPLSLKEQMRYFLWLREQDGR